MPDDICDLHASPHHDHHARRRADSAAADPCVASAGIVGGSGYTGALLAELLLGHPSVKLAAISSETFAGEPVQDHLPRLRSDLAFCSQAELGGVDVAFLCTPHGDAAPIARQLLDDGVKVIDLSADFRLDAATYAEWYGEHPLPGAAPRRLRPHRAAPRRGGRGGPRGQPRLLPDGGAARAGAAQAARARRRDHRRQVRRERRRQDAQVDDPLLQRRLGPRRLRRQSHRHYPEIAAGLAAVTAKEGYGSAPSAPGAAPAAGPAPSLTFVPHLVPLQRGISETIYVKTATLPLPSAAELKALYDDFYAGETFVEVATRRRRSRTSPAPTTAASSRTSTRGPAGSSSSASSTT